MPYAIGDTNKNTIEKSKEQGACDTVLIFIPHNMIWVKHFFRRIVSTVKLVQTKLDFNDLMLILELTFEKYDDKISNLLHKCALIYTLYLNTNNIVKSIFGCNWKYQFELSITFEIN